MGQPSLGLLHVSIPQYRSGQLRLVESPGISYQILRSLNPSIQIRTTPTYDGLFQSKEIKKSQSLNTDQDNSDVLVSVLGALASFSSQSLNTDQDNSDLLRQH